MENESIPTTAAPTEAQKSSGGGTGVSPVSFDSHACATTENILRPGVEEQIWAQLRECYDPEIPLNIVDLGLVYGVNVNGSQATVKMTLTSPGCHLGGQIASNVQERILALDEIEEANVELVWDPPWHQSMISAKGREVLGLDAT